tara:strand:+ start:84 stop:533 length:450 start_codon:yes stop_codon:yes gene_type:complete
MARSTNTSLKRRKEFIESLKIPNNVSRARDLMIGERINVPGESKAYDTERWKKEVDYTSPKKIPGEIKEVQPAIPGLEDFLAHHLKDHFQDKPLDAILQDIITNEVLSDEERARTLERILGPDYEDIINQFKQRNRPKSINNSLKIGVA